MRIVNRPWNSQPDADDSADRFIVYWLEDWPVHQAIVPAGTLAPPCPQPDHAMRSLAREAGAGTPAPTVSLVICTRDRPAHLAKCLESLKGQSLAPTEVIVVDNASVGGETREVALAAGVTYLREDRPGLDYARNSGAMAARSEIVAYTDDDVVLHPRWLERLTGGFHSEQVGAVTGLVLPAELETAAQRHFEFHWGFGRGFLPIEFGHDFFGRDWRDCCPTWEIGAGASMAFRRSVLERIGYFDERLDVGRSGCSGDSEAWHRVLAAGYLCRYEPGSVALHYHRREMTDLARQIRGYMSGHSSSILVQFGTSRGLGSLKRVLKHLPASYLRRLVSRLRDGPSETSALLFDEIAGFLRGVAYIALRPRSPVKRRLRDAHR